MDDLADKPQGVPKAHLVMVAVMMCSSFLSVLNQNLMNTALPTFMDVFGVTAVQVQWLVSAFTLANGVMIPVTAYLVNRFSTRLMYFCAMSIFAVGTVVCAAAQAFGVMLTGRVVQAIGAAILMTLMQTVLFTVFPREKRGTAMGFYGLVISFAPALGPVLAGTIIDSLPWQALFLIQLPAIAVLMLLATFLLTDVTGGLQGSLDVASVALSTLGFGGVLFGFSAAGGAGFASPEALVPIVVGVCFIVWFVVRQLRIQTPVLEFRVFTYKGFTPALVLSVGSWSLFMATAIVLPLYMQSMLGFSATESGMTLMAGGIAMGILSPLVGRVFDRVGPRVIVPLGFVLIAGAQAAFASAGALATMPYLAVAYVVFILGLTLCNMPLTTTSINTLPTPLVAHGSAMNNTLRQMFAAVATAVAITGMALAAGTNAAGAAQIPGAQAVFATLSACAVVMCLASLWVLRST